MSGTAGAFAPPIPAPQTPEGTTTTPPVTGANSGITPTAPAFPQTDATLPSNDPDYDSRERMSPEEWSKRIAAAPRRPAGGPSDTENANAQWGRDSVVRSVRQLARDAGSVTPMPVDPVPAIADKPKSAVPISKDVKPTSVRGLARAAGAR